MSNSFAASARNERISPSCLSGCRKGSISDAVRWAGFFLFAAGGALRLWPVFVLGDRLSGLVAIQPGHTLVTGGIYDVIRHPSYLGLIGSVGHDDCTVGQATLRRGLRRATESMP